MDGHVIQYRLHEALQLLLTVDWSKVPMEPEGALVGRRKLGRQLPET